MSRAASPVRAGNRPPLPPPALPVADEARRGSLASVARNRANAEERCPDILDRNVFKARFDEVQKFLKNGLYYQSVNNAPGALVSYSNAETYVHFMIQLFEHAKSKTDDTTENSNIDKYIGFLKRLEQQLLGYIEVLQEKTKNLIKSGGGGGKKEDKEEWHEVCQTVIPRIFAGEALTFADVIGLYREKDLIRTSFIKPLLLPNLFPALSKGILLFGPPGTGKTYLAKAAITELQGIDPSIGVIFFDPTGADLKGKYVGETEKRITKYFTCASRAACAAQEQSGKINKPKKYISILFIDEFDNVAGDRMSDETGLMANSVNTILQMMDGVQSFKNVAVMAATNYPWKLDAAVLRRFTNQIMINVPGSSDILDLLKYEFKKNIKIKSFNYFCYCKDEINNSVYKSGPALDALCPLTFSVKNNVKHTSDEVIFSFPLKKGDTVLGVTYNQLEDEKTGTTKLFVVVNYRDSASKTYTERYEFNVKGRLNTPTTTIPDITIVQEDLTEDATRVSTDMQILKGYLEDKMPIDISRAASRVIEKMIEITKKEKELGKVDKSKKAVVQAELDALKRDEVTLRSTLKQRVESSTNPLFLRDKYFKDLQTIAAKFENYSGEINFDEEIKTLGELYDGLIAENDKVAVGYRLKESTRFQVKYEAYLNLINYKVRPLYKNIYTNFTNIHDYNTLKEGYKDFQTIETVSNELQKLFPYTEGSKLLSEEVRSTSFDQRKKAITIYENIIYSLIIKRFIDIIDSLVVEEGDTAGEGGEAAEEGGEAAEEGGAGDGGGGAGDGGGGAAAAEEAQQPGNMKEKAFSEDIQKFKQYTSAYANKFNTAMLPIKQRFLTSKEDDDFKSIINNLVDTIGELNNTNTIFNSLKEQIITIHRTMPTTKQSTLAQQFIDKKDSPAARAEAAGEAAPGVASVLRRRHGGGYHRQTPKKKHVRRQTKRLSR